MGKGLLEEVNDLSGYQLILYIGLEDFYNFHIDSIAGFLCYLRKRHPEKCKIHIIWDNAGYHTDKVIQEFSKGLAIELHYLPPYSPNLNPIERLWKIMHEKVSANKYYETFSAFTEATLTFFRPIGKNKLLLRSRITDNFQIIHSPLFAS